MNIAGVFINHFVTPLAYMMNGAIFDYGLSIMTDLKTIRIALLVAFIVALILLYLLVLYPTARSLRIDAGKTKSLLLLLPPDVINSGSASTVGQYINEHLMKD